MRKINAEIEALEKKIAEFGYGEMQRLDSSGWGEIKKAIMASHKTSPFKHVTIKPMQEKMKFGSGNSNAWAECYVDIDCQFDSDADKALHSVTARVKVTLGDDVNVTVQTRYNQA